MYWEERKKGRASLGGKEETIYSVRSSEQYPVGIWCTLILWSTKKEFTLQILIENGRKEGRR